MAGNSDPFGDGNDRGYSVTMTPDANQRGGTLTFLYPATLSAQQTFLLVFNGTFTYGTGRATDTARWHLTRSRTPLTASVNSVDVRQQSNTEGFTVVTLDVKVRGNSGALRYQWQRFGQESNAWLGRFDQNPSAVLTAKTVSLAFENRNILRTGSTSVVYRLAVRCVVQEVSSTGTVVREVRPEGLVTIRLAAASGGQSGPSGQQAQEVAGTNTLTMTLGQKMAVAFPEEDVQPTYEVLGDDVECVIEAGGTPVIQAMREGSATFVARSSNAVVGRIPIVVSAAADADVFDMVLQAPDAIPAGTDPVQVGMELSGYILDSPTYGASVTDNALLSDSSEGTDAVVRTADNPVPYIVVPATVAADETFTLEGFAIVAGRESRKSKTITIARLGYPNAPTALVVSTVTAGGFNLAWTAAATAATRAPATGYEVRILDRDTGAQEAIYTATGTSQAVTGLSASTSYGIEIRTQSASGPSQTALTGNQKTSATGATSTLAVPLAPTSIDFSSITATGFTLGWTAPATSGATRSAVIGYRIRIRRGTAQGPVVQTQTTTATTLAITGLSALTRYFVSIEANSLSGYSDELTGNTTTVSALLPPTVPRSLASSAIGQNGFTLSWAAPAGTGRAPTTGYRVEVREDSYTGELLQTHTTAATTLAITGLTFGTNYYCLVQANSESGFSFPARITVRTTLGLVPSAPTNMTFTNVTTSSITVNWVAPPVDNTRHPVNEYRVRIRTGSASGTIVRTETRTAVQRSAVFSNLNANTTYYFSVEANSLGGYSAALNGSRSTAAPSPTLAVTVTRLPALTNENQWYDVSNTLSGTAIGLGIARAVYSWSASAGTMTSTTSVNARWRAPSVSADTTVTISCRVTIGTHTAIGTATTTVRNVTGPTLSADFTGLPSTARTGTSYPLVATRSGTATGPIGYAWRSTAGRFSASNIRNPTWTTPSSITRDIRASVTLQVTQQGERVTVTKTVPISGGTLVITMTMPASIYHNDPRAPGGVRNGQQIEMSVTNTGTYTGNLRVRWNRILVRFDTEVSAGIRGTRRNWPNSGYVITPSLGVLSGVTTTATGTTVTIRGGGPNITYSPAAGVPASAVSVVGQTCVVSARVGPESGSLPAPVDVSVGIPIVARPSG